jgi:hypothetical protein
VEEYRNCDFTLVACSEPVTSGYGPLEGLLGRRLANARRGAGMARRTNVLGGNWLARDETGARDVGGRRLGHVACSRAGASGH